MPRALPFLVVALLGSAGCTALLTYDDASPELCGNLRDDDLDGLIDCADRDSCRADPLCQERTSASCHDRVDQDLDMLFDCDDPDCDGFCVEEARTECGNGRDDDGDGYVDTSDPGCWSFGTITLSQCEDVDGSGTLDIPPRLGDWTLDPAIGGAAETVDPTGTGRHVLGAIGHEGLVRSTIASEGAWVGTSIHTRVYVSSEASFELDAGPIAIALDTDPLSSTVELDADGATDSRSFDGVGASWWTIALAVDGDAGGHVHITLDVTPDGGSAMQLAVDGAGWPSASALPLDVDFGASLDDHESVFIDVVSVTRRDGRTCSDGWSAGRGLLVGAAERPNGTPCSAGELPCPVGTTCVAGTCITPIVCATGYADDADHEDTVWSHARGGLAAALASYPLAFDLPPAPAWDPVAARFVAITAGDPSVGPLVLGESHDDCATWTELGVPTAMPSSSLPDPSVATFEVGPRWSAGYTVLPERFGRPSEHEIWVATTNDGSRGIAFMSSPDGAPSSFVPTRFVSLERVLAAADMLIGTDTDRWLDLVSAVTIGDDHVFLVSGLERTGPGTSDLVTRTYVELSDLTLRQVFPAALADAIGARLVPTTDALGGFAAHVFYRVLDRDLTHGLVDSYPIHRFEVATLRIGSAATCASPIPETCGNGVDEDCDGTIDEECP